MIKFIKQLSNLIKTDSRVFSSQSGSMANPVVSVTEGRLRGLVKELYDGSNYYSFKGIPYAQPPIGKLRFKAPLPPQPWEGIRDAIEHGPVCPQNTPTREIIEGDESCLYLNIYTRSLKDDSNIPVMVYVHGGGFLTGSGNDDMYGPEFLLDHNVILVTINYRLETFGFLCLDTPEVPGNAGLKDQVAAFRWIKRNISRFGGDPENVTIFGESAGGASVAYHILSPMSKGLFNKAISQSGICLHDWTIDHNAKARAFRVGKLLGKDTNDTEELLEYLQSVPAKELIGINFKVASDDEKRRGLPIRYRPVVEKFDNNEAFLTEDRLDLMSSAKYHPVPFIMGYNSREGFVVTQSELRKINFTNQFPSFLVPEEIARKVSAEKLKEYGERIKLFYWGHRELTPDDVDIVTDIFTDIHFVFNIYRMANMYSELCDSTYMYRFNLSSELNVYKLAMGLEEYEGAGHVDEVFYLFKNSLNTDVYEKEEKIRKLVYMVTKMWTDFAKTGNPTPDNSFGVKWIPYTARNKQYLSIDNKLGMGKNAERERLEFWTKLYKDAGVAVEIKSNL